ncbi:MAG: LamG-like jellyroll fold domain-containing protein, partial [Minisyncoccia bacterium]
MPSAQPDEGSIDVSAVVGASDIALESATMPVSPGNNYTPLSLLAWCKRPAVLSVTNASLVLGLESSLDISYYRMGVGLATNINQPYFGVSKAGGGQSDFPASDFTDNTWAPIIATFPAVGFGNIYIDGDQTEDSALSSAVFPSSLNRIRAGKSSMTANDAVLDGAVAHLAIFSGTLTAAQRTAWFAGSNAFEVEALEPAGAILVSYWPGRVFSFGGNTYMKDVV